MKMTKLGAGVGALIVFVTMLVTAPVASAVATHTFRAWPNDYCLDSDGTTPVYAGPCNGGRFQKWTWPGRLPSEGTMVNYATRRCLGATIGGALGIGPCNGDSGQRWRIYKPGGNPDVAWVRNIRHGTCLTNADRTVYLSPCVLSNTSQRWRIVP